MAYLLTKIILTYSDIYAGKCCDVCSERGAFTDRSFYRQKLLHRRFFPQSGFYTPKTFTHKRVFKEAFATSLSLIIHSLVLMCQQHPSLFTIFSSWLIICYLHTFHSLLICCLLLGHTVKSSSTFPFDVVKSQLLHQF